MQMHSPLPLPLSSHEQSSVALPSVLIIYGPTGVGKTDFALKIAGQIPAEIINMDVGQLYVPLTIGTAKPDLRSVTVPHHGFDIINKAENCTVIAYRALAEKLIQDIWRRGKFPILVGGSGFYLKSLFFPPQLESSEIKAKPEPASSSEQELERELSHENKFDSESMGESDKNALWQRLFAIDPVRAAHIKPQDVYRVKRALYIWSTTGRKPSECKPYFNSIRIDEAHIVFLGRDKSELYDRINQRIDIMMHEGWLEEAKQLIGTPWESFIQEKKLIGYNELLNFINNQHQEDLESVLMAIKQRTRHYAKRQFTFWRMFAASIAGIIDNREQGIGKKILLESVNLTLPTTDLYINQLVKKFDELLKTKNKEYGEKE